MPTSRQGGSSVSLFFRENGASDHLNLPLPTYLLANLDTARIYGNYEALGWPRLGYKSRHGGSVSSLPLLALWLRLISKEHSRYPRHLPPLKVLRRLELAGRLTTSVTPVARRATGKYSP
jgi:hypothetical protein